jgi:hypothetical protein
MRSANLTRMRGKVAPPDSVVHAANVVRDGQPRREPELWFSPPYGNNWATHFSVQDVSVFWRRCLLAFLQLVLELEDWGRLTPADDLGCSLLDEEADLCRAGDLDPVSLNYALSKLGCPSHSFSS